MKKLSRPYLVGAVLIALGLLAALLVNQYRPAQPPQSTVQSVKQRKIVIAQFGDVFLYAPLYIAKDAGMFGARGLDVTFVSTGGDEKTWAAVLSGDAAFGVADPTFVAVSAQRGRPGRVIASIVNGAPFWGITFQPAIVPFSDPKMLEGLTVATFPAPSTAFTLQKKMFSDAGITPTIREGAFGSLIAMLKAGQADIALELEPNVSQAVADGAHIVYGLDRLYGEFAITGLTALPSALQEDSKLARDVVCALSDSLAFIRSKPDEAASLLAKRFPEVSPSVARAALERMVSSNIVPSDIRVSQPAWDRAIAVRLDVGDLKTAAPYSEFVDSSFGSNCEAISEKRP